MYTIDYDLGKKFQKRAYPTVVMVTKAHQTPCPIPRKELDGNWAELVLCSYMGREEVISCRAWVKQVHEGKKSQCKSVASLERSKWPSHNIKLRLSCKAWMQVNLLFKRSSFAIKEVWLDWSERLEDNKITWSEATVCFDYSIEGVMT